MRLNSEKLFLFCKECLDICESLSVQPIVYGGLAVNYHARKSNHAIRDIDFILSETFFDELKVSFKKLKQTSCIQKDHRGLKLTRGDLVIEFDSLEQTSLISVPFIDTRIENITFKVLTLEPLIEIYQRSIIKAPNKSDKYSEQLKILYEARTNRYNTL